MRGACQNFQLCVRDKSCQLRGNQLQFFQRVIAREDEDWFSELPHLVTGQRWKGVS